MKTFKNLLTLMTLIFCLNLATAQEPQAERYENLEWYVIQFIVFEDGKEDQAKQIINDYFKPATQDAGQQLPVLELDLLFSEWDHVVVFPLEEGLEALEWKTSPGDVKAMQALLKRVGSEEKIKEIQENFSSYIKDYKVQLARKTD